MSESIPRSQSESRRNFSFLLLSMIAWVLMAAQVYKQDLCELVFRPNLMKYGSAVEGCLLGVKVKILHLHYRTE